MTIWDMIAPIPGAGGFTKEENWGAWDKLSGFTLLLLLILRRETGWPIVINCAYEAEGHKGKQHPLGNAVDWHFKTTASYREQIIKVLSVLENYQLTRIGLGIYPYWNTPGFHTDCRGEKARWAFDRNGKMVSFDEGLTWV